MMDGITGAIVKGQLTKMLKRFQRNSSEGIGAGASLLIIVIKGVKARNLNLKVNQDNQIQNRKTLIRVEE